MNQTHGWLCKWRQQVRSTNIETLRLFLHLVPSEQQRVFVLTLLIGLLCGLAAVAFHLAIQLAEQHLIDQALAAPDHWWMFWTVVTPTLGGIMSGILLLYVVPDARGSGLPQVKVAYAVKGGRMPLRIAIGKFVLGVIQIGTGASLGREGPTVQICAGIASTLGQFTALSRRNLRRLLPVGAAAGIAAAFNAPIAAVTFTIEEVVGDLDHSVLSGVIVAAAIAAAVERYVLGPQPVFTIPAGYSFDHPSSLVFYTLLGVAAATVSLIFCDALLWLRAHFQRLAVVPAWARPGVGGFVTGALAVLALAWLHTGGITGAGYATLGNALAGKLVLRVLVTLCALKIAATVFSYSSGGAGGLFAPALFIGAMLGGAIGVLDVNVLHHGPNELGAFAIVGMGAVFAGTIRAPITSVLIIFEMTGSYDLILPLMLANMLAYGVARTWRPLSVYEALLEQDGVHLPHEANPAPRALEQLPVADIMTTTVATLPADLSVEAALARIDQGRSFAAFPVVGADKHFIGLVSVARLRRQLAEQNGHRPVQACIDRRTPITGEQQLRDAVAQMDQQETRQLAVVDSENPNRLVGMLAMSDIVRTLAGMQSGTTARAAAPASLSEVAETLRDQPVFRNVRSLTDEPSMHYHIITLPADAPAADQPVGALRLPRGVLMVAIERAGHTIIPHGQTELRVGDRLTLFADSAQLAGVLGVLLGPRQPPMVLSG
ncbi:MAG: chloride channel protein [Herpetosiphonaceae bacterium]|nr:chloride channel protein [Herpetosiphonaceae bacterium]